MVINSEQIITKENKIRYHNLILNLINKIIQSYQYKADFALNFIFKSGILLSISRHKAIAILFLHPPT